VVKTNTDNHRQANEIVHLNLPTFFALTLENGVVYFIIVLSFLSTATLMPYGEGHVSVRGCYYQTEKKNPAALCPL
jgi:hypothetical protein